MYVAAEDKITHLSTEKMCNLDPAAITANIYRIKRRLVYLNGVSVPILRERAALKRKLEDLYAIDARVNKRQKVIAPLHSFLIIFLIDKQNPGLMCWNCGTIGHKWQSCPGDPGVDASSDPTTVPFDAVATCSISSDGTAKTATLSVFDPPFVLHGPKNLQLSSVTISVPSISLEDIENLQHIPVSVHFIMHHD